ncbi:MAG: HD domain-containing protein [Blautia sp.]|nr:HD domain-containing protein [Blautia sp.]
MENNLTNLEQHMIKEISHGICVSNLAWRVAKEAGLDEEQCHELAVAGMLHDVGKLEVWKYICQKGNTLNIEEMRYVRTHSTLSYTMLVKESYSPFVLESILYHHENYDGTGYPSNRAGKEIPIGARVLRVCDVFAALISNRSYRRAYSIDMAVELMIEEVKNFDMKIFLAFLTVIHQEGIEDLLNKSRLDCFEFEEEKL